VVHPVPPATGRQACVFAAVDKSRQRPESEEQNQKDGEAAPHLKLMLAETDRHWAASDKKVTKLSVGPNDGSCLLFTD
jgi:hypothetical protein